MGVHGLWQLLQTAGQPVSLESLEGKVLAVDISIWLHQTMKGMRDKDGNPLPNAHLQGLFSRVCKLLFYRIKPIFVFDGGVPALKKQTMVARRERRAEAERESHEISQKLLQNLIKSQAVRQTLGDLGGSHRHVPGVKKGRNQPDRDMFELTPLPESEEIGLTLNAEEWERDFDLQESWIKQGLAAVSDTHPDSEEFRSLPAEIQHEVLSELKEQKKFHSLSRINKMPEDSTDFSSYQLKKLMKQSSLTARIDEVRKQMTSKTAEDITCSLGDEYHGDEVEARRIVSEDAAHYVLIKGLTKRRQQEEADKYEIHSRVKLEKVEEDDNDYAADGFAGDHSLMKDKPQLRHTVSSDSESDLEAVINSRLKRRTRQKSKPSRSGMKAENPGAAPAPHQRADQIVGECEVISSKRRHLASDASCTSEDEGFIEVRIDPSAAADDDLFPASIFQTDVDGTSKDTSGTVSEQYPENAAPVSSDLIKTKNTLTEFNSSEKLSAGLADEDSDEELGDVAFSGRHWDEKKVHFPQQSETDDATARRKNVLSEILLQLEQTKKCLSDSQINDPRDTTVQISNDATMQINWGSHVGGSHIVKRSERKDLTSLDSNASCSKALSPETTFPKTQDSCGGFLTDALDEVNSFSESDEDLKIAIELSLQTNRAEKNIGLEPADCSLSDSMENTMSSNLMKHHSFEDTASALLKPQEVNKKSHTKVTSDSDNDTEDFVEVESEQLLIQNPSVSTDSETDIQEDTDADESQDSDEFSRTIAEGSGHYHSQPHPTAVLEKQPVESGPNLLQPEDYGIDQDRIFLTMDQDNLEDARASLESERSALMLERGRNTRMATSITEQTNLEAQELLKLFGIPFIVSPMEAEAQCAYLDITNQTAGTVTDDSDIWLFGGHRVYKNFFNQSKHVEFFSYDSIYSHFGVSRTQLINIALLCGSDYTEGISGVGPVRAMEIMAEFPGDGLESLHSFRRWWSRAKSQTSTSGNKIRARLKDLKVIPGFPSEAVVDAYIHPQVDDSTEKFTWGLPDLDTLREFTKYKFGWSKEKTDQSLLPMMKQLSKKESQGRIHMYFQPQYFTKVSKIHSERLKRALAFMKNPQQTLQGKDKMYDNSCDSSHVDNTEVGQCSGQQSTKKRRATEHREDGSDSQSKQKVIRNKPVKQISKKKVKTVEAVKERQQALVKKQIDVTEEVTKVAETESEVMKMDTEQLNTDDTEKVRMRINVGNAAKKKQKQIKETKRINKSNIEKTLTKNTENKLIYTGKHNLTTEDKRKKKLVADKQNHRHKETDNRSDIIQNIEVSFDRGKGRRGRRIMGDKYIGGRGKLPVSLDKQHVARSKNVRKSKPSMGRGIVNLSESSGSDSSNDIELSDISKCDITHNKQGQHSKNIHISKANKDMKDKTVPVGATQQNRLVETQVSESRNTHATSQQTVTVPASSQCTPPSNTGKKVCEKFLNTDRTTVIPPVMSTELSQSKQNITSCKADSSPGNEETDTDIRKADVSIINRQNLPSTLTYLNRRSREDQMLLHQLKGNKTVNAVEKRLEESQKKSILDKHIPVSTGEAPEQGISFGDMLGGLDVVATKSVHSKGKTILSNKKQPTGNASQVKTLQNKIFQQIDQFGSVLAGTSSNDNSDTRIMTQSNNQARISDKGNHSHDNIHMINNEKQSLAVNKHQITNSKYLTGIIDEKAVTHRSSVDSFVSTNIHGSSRQNIFSVQKEKTLKSSRSKAFDKPIGECSSEDSVSDGDTKKISKKKKFLKQMEHLGDSKSVKGLGVMPRQNAEQTVRGKTFARKGIGKGKNRTDLAEISDKREAKNASEDELLEYAFITADDLGSDFSDFDG